MFKPNTKYTLCFKKTVGLSSVAICNGSGAEFLAAHTPVIDNKVVFTAPSNLETETQMRLYGLGDRLNIDIELIGLADIDSELPNINENGKTPLENAEIKAK